MHKGRLTISCITSNVENDYVTIRLNDDCNFSQIVDIKIDLETFVKIITGMGWQPVEYEVRNINYIGVKKDE